MDSKNFEIIGAETLLRIKRKDKIIYPNSFIDFAESSGYIKEIEKITDNEFKNIKNILIIGAGGTAKALASRFLDEGVFVSVLNRSEKRLEYFKDKNKKTPKKQTVPGEIIPPSVVWIRPPMI